MQTYGQCASPITSKSVCAEAAALLGMLDTSASDDNQDGVWHDPKGCYFEGGALKYNKLNTNTGDCDATDQCLCDVVGLSCTDCPAGKWQGETASAVCVACAAGRFSAVEALASDSCADCEAGRFSAAAGSAACTACPAGKWQGETASAVCVACAAGRFSAEEAVTCSSECAAGRYVTAGSAACKACPAGKWQNVTGASACVTCEAGC